jgi:hypothetical protein
MKTFYPILVMEVFMNFETRLESLSRCPGIKRWGTKGCLFIVDNEEQTCRYFDDLEYEIVASAGKPTPFQYVLKMKGFYEKQPQE